MTNDRGNVVVWLEARGGAPEWILMLPRGEVQLADGRPPFLVDDEAMQGVLARFAARGNDLVVDYEHMTLDAAPAPAAGWIKALEAREDGLWARVEWTDKALAFIEAREYRYFSPVVQLDKERRVEELLHAGLTNNPAMSNMMPLAAKGGHTWPVAREMTAPGRMEKGDEGMLEKLKSMLGLPHEANELTAWAAVEAMAAIKAAWSEVTEALGLETGADANKVKAAVLGLKQGRDAVGQLQEELAALKGQLADKEAEAAVEAAMAAGKITPAQHDWALKYARQDLTAFRVFVEQAPVVVPLERLARGDEAPAASAGGLDDNALDLCRMMGLDPQAFKAQQAREQGGTA